MDDLKQYNKAPVISIIVPIYKVEQYLSKCIDSILSQTFADFELILVDDGSPDSCGIICDEYSERDNRIIVIHKENGGLSSARNAGLDISKGKYIGFIDSDDYIESDMYELLYNNIIASDSDIAVCGIYYCYKNIIQSKGSNSVEGTFTGIDALKLTLSGKSTFSAWNKLYKRNIFDTIRYPIDKRNEDFFVIGDIMLKAKRVILECRTPKYYYVQRQGSIMRESFSPLSFHAVEAAEYNLSLICNNAPDAASYGLYALWGAYRIVLNQLSLASSEDRLKYESEIKKIGKSMRGYIKNILTCTLSGYKRKCANLAIVISPYLYMCILKLILARRSSRYQSF